MVSFVNSTAAERVLSLAEKAIREHNMEKMLRGGVLVGLSGGADSVMLLLVLCELRKRHGGSFEVKAVHVNHMIRGSEADRDEDFSRELCKGLGVPFFSERIDVPKLAERLSCGIEEAARKARYDIFDKIVKADGELSCVAVAHNATDNLETVIFNIMRGAGIVGGAGIPPVRDNIIRPLIYSPKADIVSALESLKVEYVTDSTNLDSEYSRNHIRNNIIPLLSRLTSSPENMATRFSANLRADHEFINSYVKSFLEENYVDGRISKEMLVSLNSGIFHGILTEIVRQKSDCLPERVHSEAIFSKLTDDNFSISIPGNLRFVCEYGICYVENDKAENCKEYDMELKYGVNVVDGFSTVILVSDDKNFESFSNIYKIAIRSQIPSDIIENGFRVRNKRDGDSYSYGGFTHKLKKLFSDRSIPKSKRSDVPVFLDSEGIIWVAGFCTRKFDSSRGISYVALAEPIVDQGRKRKFYYNFNSK